MGEGPNPLQFHVDPALFPKAYGVLANEHLMHPIDQSDWPVKIDRSRQLFIDDYLIASLTNITRQVHEAQKHPANPLMEPDRPWEGKGCVFQHVHWDDESNRFRMWYGGSTSFHLPSGIRIRQPTCYAESDDGLTWVKPNLGLCEYDGSKANNIVILTGGLFAIFDEPDAPDPSRRFKALVWHDWRDSKPVPPEGYYLFSSPDGIHWKQDRTDPVIWSQNRQQPGVGDTSTARWDARLGKYICDAKILFRNPTMRSRGMIESDDLIHWSRPRMTFYPDALDAADTQIYGHLGFVYESMWVGLLRAMHTEQVPNSDKQTTIELTASRDGRHWSRVGRREEFIALGEPGSWDPHYHDPHTPPVLVGDELWFYYRSMPLPAPRSDPQNAKTRISRIGLATLRRDGFVSLNGTDDPGLVVTRPLTFDGCRLFVNAQVGDGGYIKAEIRNTAGEAVKPYVMSECQPLTTDVLNGQVVWAGQTAVQRSADQSMRIAFEVKNARLYSFWLE
ncbi:MAG: hypothetical protein CMJ20_12370 [Phycisphaeraceae bacterium]|nr:hypothetical protein [Phycisphaeraceae bacterium]